MERLKLPGRPQYVGAHISRIEDERLLMGRASFVADLRIPGTVELAITRSPLPHARINAIGLDAARSSKGVVSAVTADDLDGVSPFPDFVEYAQPVRFFPLCRDRVRYVGAPVAAIVAEDRYLAEDAAELVELDLDELPAIASIDAAMARDAPKLYDDWPDNKMVEVLVANPEIDSAFARSQVLSETYTVQRHTGMPIETRGALAEYRDGRLTLWTGTQNPHIVRTTLSYLLPLAERDIRVIAPDVGGAFGCKQHIYPEDVLVSWFAMRLGRPVRFVEDRAEHMVAACHARDEEIQMEAAVDDEGRILALRARILQDLGSGEIFTPGFSPSFVTGGHMTGPYRIPLAEISVTCVVTNKTPSGAFRGYGIPEAVFALERFVEKVARHVGVDALDVRRKMLVSHRDLPYVNALGGILDSGSFRGAFERAVELGRDLEAKARDRFGDIQHIRVGVGHATYVEGTAGSHYGTSNHWTSYDSCSLRIDPDGGVVLNVGVTTQGQGVESMAATLAADALGVPIGQVSVVMGDTDLCPYGLGAWGSRSTVIGGGSILRAAAIVREKALRIAGHMLEADPTDLVLEHGRFRVRGADRGQLSLADVGRTAWIRTLDLPAGEEPGLEATASYDPPGLEHIPDEFGRMNGASAWANATHVAVVALDIATGEVEVIDYAVVHDCGPLINPIIVEGQIHGGVAQGIGGALYEDLPYGTEGQPLVGGFMDYLIPTSTEIPSMAVEHMASPSPKTPLGVKGVGEGGTIGPPAAIANAVANALAEFDVDVTATPITPPIVWGLIRAARAQAR